jgi:hypothetical protein
MEQDIRKLEDTVSDLTDQVQEAMKRISFLDGAEDWYSDPPSPAKENCALPKAADIQAVIAQISQLRTEAMAALRRAEREKRNFNEKLAALREEYRKKQTPSDRNEKRIHVELDVKKGGTFRLDTSYVLPGASWRPNYLLRSDAARKAVALQYSALVSQKTGEDWTDAKISLSTAEPSVSGATPKTPLHHLRPKQGEIVASGARKYESQIRLGNTSVSDAFSALGDVNAGVGLSTDAIEPVQIVTSGRDAEETGVQGGTVKIIPKGKLEEPETQVLSLDSGGVLAVFDVPVRHTIKSGEEALRLDVGTSVFEAQSLNYIAVPEASPRVFTEAKVQNTSGWPVLPGPAQIFVENNLIASAALSLLMPGQEVSLPLGAAQGIEVERAQTGRLMKDLSRASRVTDSFKIKMKNLRKESLTLTVRQAFPVSQRSEILVRMESVEPKPGSENKEGAAEWEIPLAPGEERLIEYSYSIEYPSRYRIEDM